MPTDVLSHCRLGARQTKQVEKNLKSIKISSNLINIENVLSIYFSRQFTHRHEICRGGNCTAITSRRFNEGRYARVLPERHHLRDTRQFIVRGHRTINRSPSAGVALADGGYGRECEHRQAGHVAEAAWERIDPQLSGGQSLTQPMISIVGRRSRKRPQPTSNSPRCRQTAMGSHA